MIIKIYNKLKSEAKAASNNSWTPYAQKPVGVALLLSDGQIVKGSRVENASYPLTIPALLNVVTTAVAAGRRDFKAVVASRPFTQSEFALFSEALPRHSVTLSEDTMTIDGDTDWPNELTLLDPFWPTPNKLSLDEGQTLASKAANQAYIPLSDFPVGAIIVLEDGRILPGCNAEHPDWLHTLCAERNAIGTAVSYGVHDIIKEIHLACLKAENCSPCGGCRQVLNEFIPFAPIYMKHLTTTADDLLPHSFKGSSLPNSVQTKS